MKLFLDFTIHVCFCFCRIGKREDCEMIMLMGLPGCGKTTWTEKHVSEHPEKRYNVIGTTRLEDRMNVSVFEQKIMESFAFTQNFWF